jgi:hypothetical protein
MLEAAEQELSVIYQLCAFSGDWVLCSSEMLEVAEQELSVVYPKMTHFICVANAFHYAAEVLRDN